MTEQYDGFTVVHHGRRCGLCGRGHRTERCNVAIHWTITRDESTEIFRSRTEQTNVELAIRAELAKLRDSAVLTKPVRKLSVVYV
jgi:hypothetical protein